MADSSIASTKQMTKDADVGDVVRFECRRPIASALAMRSSASGERAVVVSQRDCGFFRAPQPNKKTVSAGARVRERIFFSTWSPPGHGLSPARVGTRDGRPHSPGRRAREASYAAHLRSLPVCTASECAPSRANAQNEATGIICEPDIRSLSRGGRKKVFRTRDDSSGTKMPPNWLSLLGFQ